MHWTVREARAIETPVRLRDPKTRQALHQIPLRALQRRAHGRGLSMRTETMTARDDRHARARGHINVPH